MADLFFKCSACGRHLLVEEAGVGMTFDCLHCNQPVTVPSAVREIECPNCRLVLKLAAEMDGEQLPCPGCSQPVTVPFEIAPARRTIKLRQGPLAPVTRSLPVPSAGVKSARKNWRTQMRNRSRFSDPANWWVLGGIVSLIGLLFAIVVASQMSEKGLSLGNASGVAVIAVPGALIVFALHAALLGSLCDSESCLFKSLGYLYGLATMPFTLGGLLVGGLCFAPGALVGWVVGQVAQIFRKRASPVTPEPALWTAQPALPTPARTRRRGPTGPVRRLLAVLAAIVAFLVLTLGPQMVLWHARGVSLLEHGAARWVVLLAALAVASSVYQAVHAGEALVARALMVLAVGAGIVGVGYFLPARPSAVTLETYRKITQGMPESEVVTLLGPAHETENNPAVPDHPGLRAQGEFKVWNGADGRRIEIQFTEVSFFHKGGVASVPIAKLLQALKEQYNFELSMED